jgi:hypothetical protein
MLEGGETLSPPSPFPQTRVRKEAPMADRVRKVTYSYLKVPSRPGQGARVLAALKDANVNLLAYTGFPAGGGKAQLDLVTDDQGAVSRVARKEGWRLSRAKKGFLIQGDDKVGAVQRHLQKLAAGKVNVIAADAVTAGKGRYGMILWVRPTDYGRAARLLGAT